MKKTSIAWLLLISVGLFGCSQNEVETTTTTSPPVDNVSTDTNEVNPAETDMDANQEAATVIVIPPSTQTPPLDADSPVFNPSGPANPNTTQVTFPNGGEILEVGSSYTVAWETEGAEVLNLEVYEDGKLVETIAERVIAANGIFEWTPAARLLGGENFRQLTLLTVDADTGQKYDESDATFILQARN